MLDGNMLLRVHMVVRSRNMMVNDMVVDSDVVLGVHVGHRLDDVMVDSDMVLRIHVGHWLNDVMVEGSMVVHSERRMMHRVDVSRVGLLVRLGLDGLLLGGLIGGLRGGVDSVRVVGATFMVVLVGAEADRVGIGEVVGVVVSIVRWVVDSFTAHVLVIGLGLVPV